MFKSVLSNLLSHSHCLSESAINMSSSNKAAVSAKGLLSFLNQDSFFFFLATIIFNRLHQTPKASYRVRIREKLPMKAFSSPE